MSRRFRIVLILCLVAAANGLIWFAINTGSSDDPLYHGRRLTRWLEDASRHSYSLHGQHEQLDAAQYTAQEALKGMGTNAFPFLIKLAAAKDSPTKQKLLDWLERHHVSFIHMTSAGVRNDEAIEGFELLGTGAKPAIPALSKLLNDTRAHLINA